MAFSDFFKRAGKITADNSPNILTAIGVTGTIATAVLTGKASLKAGKIIEREMDRRDRDQESPYEEMGSREAFEMVWKLYIPAAVSMSMTIACIIGANRIGTRRAAAMAAAYSLSERAYTEYKDKIIEKFGETKEQAARDEIAQERIDRNPISEKSVIVASGGDVLCYDAYTDRYFRSDMETLRKAQNDINQMVINANYASLSDFYDHIGLPRTSHSDEVGWTTEKMLELHFSAALVDDKNPCISIEFAVAPVRDYYRVH
jgi:hypothetical protein